jgi:hypothetical protein
LVKDWGLFRVWGRSRVTEQLFARVDLVLSSLRRRFAPTHMRIAIEGCCHGALDKIYSSLSNIMKRDGKPIDLLLICGDFQSIRNANDLSSMSVPDKFKEIGNFYEYYSGIKKALVPTIFIGGLSLK